MFNILSKIIYNLNEIICYIIALLINWLFKLVDGVGLSINRITASFPGLDTTVYSTVKVVGYALACLFFVFGILQFLFPNAELDLPSENHIGLIFRFAISVFLCAGFKDFFINGFVNKLFIPVFNEINANLKIDLGTYWLDNIISDIASITSSTLNQILNFIIIIIFGVVFLINAVKFVIYHFERLFELTFLIYASPLACATYTHKALSPIFKNYIKLMVEQALCIIFNLIVVKLIMNGLVVMNTTSMLSTSALADIVTGSDLFLSNTRNYVIQMLFLTALLSVGKKMSVKVGQVLGMNGMSDAVRPGLGMLGAVGGFAAHSVIHGGHGGNHSSKTDNANAFNAEAKGGETGSDLGTKIGMAVSGGNPMAGAVGSKIGESLGRKAGKMAGKVSNSVNDLKDRANKIAQDQDANVADTDSVNSNPNQDKENQNGADTQNAQNPNMDKNAEGKETNQVPNAEGKETNQMSNENQNGQQNTNGKETEKANANSINKNENSPTANTTNNGMNKNDIANQENSNANNNNSKQNGGNAANTENVSNMNAQNKNENSNNNSANATNTNKVDQAIKNGGNTATQNISDSAKGGSNASSVSTKVVSGATSKQTSGTSGGNSRPSAPSGNNRPGSKNNYVQSTQQGSVSHNNTQNVSHSGNNYNSTPSSNTTPNSGTSGAGSTGSAYSPQSSNSSMPQSSGSENSGQSFKKIDFD